MTSSIYRGDLTAYLFEQLNTLSVLVGDGMAPDAGGWDDDPNDPASSYAPYLVMTPLTSTDATGSIADSSTDITLPYSFSAYGVSRDQVEFYADECRQKIVNLSRSVVTLTDGNWKIQQARCTSIGGVARSDNVEPSEFSQTDVIVLYMSKEI